MLTEQNAPMKPFGQGFRSMAGPTKEFERLALKRDIKHFNNPVFSWMLQNVQIERNADEQIKLSKKKSREKIDGPVALMNAIGAWLSDVDNEDNELPEGYELIFT
jgi:phage terminase large subunit-like protein